MNVSQKKCALCSEVLTEINDTDEHIIPNAIGGRKTVRGFICESCNNTAGGNWDKAVADQFSDLSLLVGIRRQRGKVPSINFETKDGKLVSLNIDGEMFNAGKAVVTENINSHGGTINIQASTHEQADKIMGGLKKKYEKRGVKNIQFKKEERVEAVVEEKTFSLSFGENGSGKSYVKTAMAMASKHGFNIDDCECAKEYLTNDGVPCFGYYYSDDVLVKRPELLHFVGLEGKSEEHLLLGYVEYFSFCRIVVCLSKNYYGNSFKESYALDPRNGENFDVDFNLSFSEEDIEKLYKYEFYVAEELHSSLAKLLKLTHERMEKLEFERNVEAAYSRAKEELGIEENEELDEERYKQLCIRISNYIMPYFSQRIHRNRIMRERMNGANKDEMLDE